MTILARPLRPAPLDGTPRAVAPQGDVSRERERTHFLCSVLRLPRLCARAKCRRADLCRGRPRACLDSNGQAAPTEVLEFAELLLDAIATGEEMEALEETYPENALAWRCWIAALDARR
jgi:hypothetical protein